MKHFFTSLFVLFACCAIAQPSLPQPSPGATAKQTVGLTDIEVVYSRPGKKNRKIFGELVPFNELWRTGANKATAISFNTDITIGGKAVKAGTYSLFTKPGKTEWTIILNSETELWGTGGFDEAKNVASFKVKSKSLSNTVETFTINFRNITENDAELFIQWDNTEASCKITVDCEAQAWKNIDESIKNVGDNWRIYVRSADYAVNKGKKLDEALAWTEKALAMEEYWWTYWVQARVYAAKGDYKNAQKSLKSSIKLGEETKDWGYGEKLEKLMEEYKTASKKK